MNNKNVRFLGIDFLRFVCALSVVLFHYFYRGTLSDSPILLKTEIHSLSEIFKYGFLGVQIFFVISGFVILNSALEKDAKRFLISRFLRIYPAFLICATITFMACRFIPVDDPNFHKPGFVQYIVNLTMLSTIFKVEYMDGVYWTLIYEIIFYAYIFLLILTGKLKFIEYFIIFGLTASTVYWSHSIFGTPFPRHTALPLACDVFGFFSAGSLLYLNYLNGPSRLRNILLIVSYFLSLVQIDKMSSGLSITGGHVNSYIAAVIYTVLLLLFIAVIKNPAHFKNKNLWIFIGNLTYPLYLIHQMVGYIIIHHFTGKIGDFTLVTLTILSVIILSALIHIYGELPIRKLLKNLLIKI